MYIPDARHARQQVLRPVLKDVQFHGPDDFLVIAQPDSRDFTLVQPKHLSKSFPALCELLERRRCEHVAVPKERHA